MIQKTRPEIPPDHPIRKFFQQLTERGMGQLNLHDPDTIQYITNLLTEFIQIENERHGTGPGVRRPAQWP